MSWLSWASFAAILLLPSGVCPQEIPPPTPSMSQIVAESVDLEGLIRLDVVATGPDGHPVVGLPAAAFTLFDNGHPRPIIAFRPNRAAAGQASSGVSVILLLDTLDLPSKLAHFERDQAVAFLRRNGGRLTSPVAVYTLADSGLFFAAGPSTDGDRLAQGLLSGRHQEEFPPVPMQVSAVRPPYAGAPWLNSPLETGLHAISAIAAAADKLPGRKVLLWIGPGLTDNKVAQHGTGQYPENPFDQQLVSRGQQQAIFDQVVWFSTLLRQAGVTLDVFSVGEEDFPPVGGSGAPSPSSAQILNAWKQHLQGVAGPSQSHPIDLYKKVLAIQSGGRVLPPSADLVAQIEDCVRSAGAYYSLTFDPPPAGRTDEYHSLELRLAPPALTAHLVSGYYDQPWYQRADASLRSLSPAALEALLHPPQGKPQPPSDWDNLRLAERLTPAAFARLSADLHGGKAHERLEILADRAEFEPPPPSMTLPNPPPDAAGQQRILASAAEYLAHAIHKLPDFFSIRTASLYEDTAGFHELNADIAAVPMHLVERKKASILYRQGAEVVGGSHPKDASQTGFYTYGTFGPVLFSAQRALETPSTFTWLRWEAGPIGKMAVFRFTATMQNSMFAVTGCCLPDRPDHTEYGIHPPYSGEMAIDPATGALLRMQIVANLGNFAPVSASAIMVAYAPVEIGGNRYIVPQRSVSLWRGRSQDTLSLWDSQFRVWSPWETRINEFTFDHYRVFRGTARILPGYTVGPAPPPPQ